MTSSQPELTKLYNENIGGHHYTFTATQMTIALIFIARQHSDARY